MKEATSFSLLLTSTAAVAVKVTLHGLLGPQVVWILWVGTQGVRGRLRGPPTVLPMKGLTKWQLNTIPLSTARNVIHTHTGYTQTNVSSVHFCLKTPNNPLGVDMNNVEHSFTHYKTLTQHMKELGKKAQAGKGSCEKHCYWHDWNRVVTWHYSSVCCLSVHWIETCRV